MLKWKEYETWLYPGSNNMYIVHKTHLFFNSKDGDVVVEEDEEGKRSDLIEEIKEGLEKDNSDGKWDDLLTLPFLVFTL